MRQRKVSTEPAGEYEEGDHILVNGAIQGTFLVEMPRGYAEFVKRHLTLEEARKAAKELRHVASLRRVELVNRPAKEEPVDPA